MPDPKRIDQLPDAASLDGGELVPLVQGGATKRSVLSAIAAFVTNSLSAVLGAKAPLASPTLTGTPTAPTAAVGTNSGQVATTAFVAAALAVLTDGAPGALNQFIEVYTRFLADEGAAAALTATVAGKLAAANNLSDLTDLAAARSVLGFAGASTSAGSQTFAAASFTFNDAYGSALRLAYGQIRNPSFSGGSGTFGYEGASGPLPCLIGMIARSDTETPLALEPYSAAQTADLLSVLSSTGAKVFAVSPSGGLFATLPTSDPHVAGEFWRSGNAVMISTG